jgi:hypothetical protein
MLDYTNYNYKEKPFTKTNKFGVHPLSQTGQHEYICKDSQVHWYLHKIPPRLLAEIYGKDNATEENKEASDEPVYTKEFDSEKLESCYQQQLEQGEEDGCHDGANVNNDYGTQEWYDNERPIHTHGVRYHPYYANKPQTSTAALRVRYGSKNQKPLKDSRFFTNYLNEVETIKQDRFNSTSSLGFRKKNYDGFTSYQVPRINPEYKEEFRKTKIMTEKISNSVYNPTSANTDVNEENERLRNILMNQTNKNFLNSKQLPQISVIVNQPKTLLKKTNTSNTKMMGGKYNPFNYHGTNKNWTKRNYLGALYQH